jgi:hypothetical protein
MPGITLDDIASEKVEDTAGVAVESAEDEFEVEAVRSPSRFNEMFSKVLTAETGEGSISDYIDHPMNFKKSEGLAQILRGLTGIVGNLKLAIIDVVFGALRFSNEGKGQTNNVGSNGGIWTP